jgi:hypothetical protein
MSMTKEERAIAQAFCERIWTNPIVFAYFKSNFDRAIEKIDPTLQDDYEALPEAVKCGDLKSFVDSCIRKWKTSKAPVSPQTKRALKAYDKAQDKLKAALQSLHAVSVETGIPILMSNSVIVGNIETDSL